jgi:hypothetical protein
MGVVEEVFAKAEKLSGKERLMRKGLGKGPKRSATCLRSTKLSSAR